MDDQSDIVGMTQLLDRIESTLGEKPSLSVADVRRALGRRSFGPFLLLPALIVVSPLSGIPTLPTLAATIIAIVAAQILVGCEHFWLPERLAERAVTRAQLFRALRFLRPIARVSDRLVRPRLTAFTRAPASKGIALICILIAITIPPLELLPFTSSLAAAIIAVYALALTADDGLLALIAFSLTLAVVLAPILTFA